VTSLTRIINKVSRDTGIGKGKVKDILTKTFSQIQVNLEDDKNVMLRGFAKFVKAKRKTKQEETNWNKFKTKLK
jgi:nucleoid DNA-binding protein|tara:strand:+ start:183 stop:404 length:222 start_codon:yes stop_codon:yes gene_type:complete